MFINIAELKARVPKPIVEIKNVLLISTKLVLHEIQSFERYFQRFVIMISLVADPWLYHGAGVTIVIPIIITNQLLRCIT